MGGGDGVLFSNPRCCCCWLCVKGCVSRGTHQRCERILFFVNAAHFFAWSRSSSSGRSKPGYTAGKQPIRAQKGEFCARGEEKARGGRQGWEDSFVDAKGINKASCAASPPNKSARQNTVNNILHHIALTQNIRERDVGEREAATTCAKTQSWALPSACSRKTRPAQSPQSAFSCSLTNRCQTNARITFPPVFSTCRHTKKNHPAIPPHSGTSKPFREIEQEQPWRGW